MISRSVFSFPALVLITTLLARRANAEAGATRVEEWPSESILETLSASAATFTESLNTMSEPSTFRFKNSKGQFVKMPIWVPKALTSRNISPFVAGTLFTLQFRTSQASELLLYLDDGGPRDYIQLALRSKMLELRFKFGDAAGVKVTLGKNLNDRRWHSVSMEVTESRITLSVDGLSTVGTAEGPSVSPIVPRSYCYLGGIPSVYRLMDLSLPSVFFESGLQGAIRRYAIDGKYQRPVEKNLVVEEIGSDLCYSERNPCQNNGACYSLNNEPACDCSETTYSGIYCDGTREDAAAATFLGSQWFEYDMTRRSISSFQDTITLLFKTKQRNGLMLHTGKSADFVNLSIKNGAISLVVNLGSGAFEVLLNPTTGSFNDNKWHSLKLYRELRRVNLTVDNAETTSGVTQNDYTQLTLDDVFYIGGSPSTTTLPGSSQTNNFIGCLKEVTYKSMDTVLPFSRMANRRNLSLRVVGDVQNRCDDIDISGPVTFKTPNSFLKLPSWKNPESGGLKLEFKTTEPHGLLLFGSGNVSRDFFALELFEGNLYVLINLGSGIKKQRCSNSQPLNDGNWHTIKLGRYQSTLTVNIDNQDVRKSLEGANRNLDLDGLLYLGGADFDSMANFDRLPRGAFTISLKYGFVGCMRAVYIDGVGIDLKVLAKDSSDNPDSVGPECANLGTSFCANQPCKNGGRCSEGWNRYKCDCSETPFSGDTCELAVFTAGFNGSQWLRLPMTKTKRTQAEEISFRFRTPLSAGLLLTTTSDNTADRLTVKLVKGGQVKLTVDIDCFRKNCTAPRQGPESIFQGQSLNDNQWHTVKIQRFGRRLNLRVDGKLTGNSGLLQNGHTELQLDAIHLGRVTGTVVPKVASDLGPPFVGLIQNLIFNKEPLIDGVFQEKTTSDFTGSWGESNIISNPITFGDKDTYVATGTLDAYRSMTLFFTLRTTVSDGLILYNAGRGGDFIAVELVAGFIHYVYNLGNGPQIMSTPDQAAINDNQWHEIRIARDVSNTHTLSVDGSKVTQQGSTAKLNLDLEGPLYVGGVRQDLYFTGLPDRVVSRFGFQGCLGTFDFNGFTPQLLGNDRLQMSGNVFRGCIGPTEACTETSCLNDGICRQEWSTYSCDCSMSSYVGNRCNEHISLMSGGASYQFKDGMLIYKWPSASFPSSRRDSLSMGFATRERDCALTKISSLEGSTISDYMQLEIESGRLTLRFNIGSKDVVLREPKSVADGQYHRVVISRIWMNATLRVDSWPERKAEPNGNPRKRYDLATTSIPLHSISARTEVAEWLRKKGTKNTVFNSQSMIQIGGLIMDENPPSPNDRSNWSRDDTNIVRPFKGLMTGFFFNGIEVFTLAERGSEQVNLIGNVKLIGDPPVQPTPPGGVVPTTMVTMTTFTTSSTKAVSVENASKDSECLGEELCAGDVAILYFQDPQSDDGNCARASQSPATHLSYFTIGLLINLQIVS